MEDEEKKRRPDRPLPRRTRANFYERKGELHRDKHGGVLFYSKFARIPFEISTGTPNEETGRAIENVKQGKNLSRAFHSVAELMEDLYAEKDN